MMSGLGSDDRSGFVYECENGSGSGKYLSVGDGSAAVESGCSL